MVNLHPSEAPSSTRFESVVEALRAAILAGEFQAGERLHEVKLTAQPGLFAETRRNWPER